MTEMMGVTVTAGGSVTRQTWREFMRDMAATGFTFEVCSGHLHFSDEANYGNTDDVREACQNHGIAVRAACDAKYEWSGDVKVWFPGMPVELEAIADQTGAAVIPVADLQQWLKDGQTLKAVVERHEPFIRPIPPMLIDGQPVTDADLEDAADDEDDDQVAA